jgi:hypothetical protein
MIPELAQDVIGGPVLSEMNVTPVPLFDSGQSIPFVPVDAELPVQASVDISSDGPQGPVFEVVVSLFATPGPDELVDCYYCVWLD